MRSHVLLISLLGLLPAVALCDQAPAPPMGVWTGKGQLGFLGSQGNTDAQSLNAAFDAGLLSGLWQHTAHLDYLYGQSAHVVAAERWDAQWQSNYSFAPRMFAFGAAQYQHDMFSGFQYQASETVGVGYKLINSAATKLDVQVGVGDQQLRPEDLIKNGTGAVIYRIPGPSQSSAIVSGGINYSQVLTSTATLTNKLLLQSGSANTLLTDALALTVKMSTRLALSLGYNLQNNSNPPAGLKKLDTTETVNLVFSF